MHKISVVIPTFNDSPVACLNALNKQSLDKNFFEVIVVDNASDKLDIKAITKQFKNIIYIRENRKGVYYARNKGWKATKHNIIAFTDADCRPDKNWLKEILSFFENKNEFAMGGSIIKTKPRNWIEKNADNLADGQRQFRYKPYLPGYPYVVAANMAFRKNLIEKLKGFNQIYTSGGDGDFCWRLKRKGYKLRIYPKAIVFHPARSTIRSYFKQHYSYGVGHPLQFKIHYPKKIKIFIDIKNFKDLLGNLILLPYNLILYFLYGKKYDKGLRNLLKIIRASAIILGRIQGSIKYKVIYI